MSRSLHSSGRQRVVSQVVLGLILASLIGCMFGLDGYRSRQNRKCPPTWEEYKKEVNKNGWLNGCGYFMGNGMLAIGNSE